MLWCARIRARGGVNIGARHARCWCCILLGRVAALLPWHRCVPAMWSQDHSGTGVRGGLSGERPWRSYGRKTP